jgi:putative CocE/NonD family hydrolase
MTNPFKVKQTTDFLITGDQVRLDADIYSPDAPGEFPVLVMRQPYGRKIASTVVYAHPRWYAAQGYIVVIQDVRGRGTSQGKFKLFEAEKIDGAQTIDWASQLPQSTGVVGMYGFSYQGMTQLYAASQKPDALKTICPAMIALDLYRDWAYENEAFCLTANLGWAMQLAAETARLKGDNSVFGQLFQASRQLPLNDPFPSHPQIIQELAPDSFYHDWILRSPQDNYWQELSPANFVDTLDLPMLQIGGWFDPHLRGTLKLYEAMLSQSHHEQRLVIGAWAHLPWGQRLGGMNYGLDAVSFIDQLQIAWFDYYLKGKSSPLLARPRVSLFEMGSNRWRYFDRFPHGESSCYFLESGGLANLRPDSGTLSEIPRQNSEDYLVHDPWRPVPTLGGHASLPAGSQERSQIDDRPDVATYTSPPLKQALSMIGAMAVELYVLADTPSFDLSVILSELYPDGRIFNISQGYRRIDRAESPMLIPLQAIAIQIPPGHQLRLSLSGSCFPAYPVNPGTGQRPHETQLIDAQVITITIRSGVDYPSCLRFSTVMEADS